MSRYNNTTNINIISYVIDFQDKTSLGQTFTSYYQMVPITLFFQGLLCYFPYFIWNSFQDQILLKIVQELKIPTFDLHLIEEKTKTLGLLLYF